MNTECKDCKFREGNCGKHFISVRNGSTNYDIPSLSACDKYGNCWFFKPKEKPKGDLISREALKEQIKEDFCKRRCPMPEKENYCNTNCAGRLFMNIVDNAPTIEYTFDEAFKKTVCEQELYCPKRPTGKWEEPFEMNGKSYHKCTNCHISSELILIDKYCPECGAYMRGEKDDR